MNFRTTRWSVVLAAGGDSRRALEELCTDYWYPLYAVARRRGQHPQAAEDLVQGFFVYLLEKEVLATADPERGRFRSYLRTCFENFMRGEWERASAQKRGGHISFVGAEDHYAREPEGTDPFDRAWAHTLLRSTLARLREEYASRDKESLFSALKETLTGGDSYASIAQRLDSTEGAVKVAAHRLRIRYREAIRAAIAETVTDEAAIEDEIRDLFRAL